MLIGAHVSPAGGPANAVTRGEERACRSIQIFNQNPRAWKARVYSDEELAAYHEAMTDQRLWPADPKAADGLLTFFLLEKALNEIEHELSFRPEWLRVPLIGIIRMLSQPSFEAS